MDLAYSSSLSQKKGEGGRRREKAANFGRGRVMRTDGCCTGRWGKGGPGWSPRLLLLPWQSRQGDAVVAPVQSPGGFSRPFQQPSGISSWAIRQQGNG